MSRSYTLQPDDFRPAAPLSHELRGDRVSLWRGNDPAGFIVGASTAAAEHEARYIAAAVNACERSGFTIEALEALAAGDVTGFLKASRQEVARWLP